jgi:hypothetical protein
MIERSDKKGHPETDVDGLVSPRTGFAGIFSGLNLPNLIQMLAMNSFTGGIRLQRGVETSEIFLRDGEIVHATWGTLTGVEAFGRILSWEQGEIQLDPDETPPKETIDIPWESLLIQSIARIEESGTRPTAPEPTPPARAPHAFETLQLNRLYSSAMGWSDVVNCLIFLVETGEIVRPTAVPQKFREWANGFRDLLRRAFSLQALDGNPDPQMLSVTLERRTWILIPHYFHIVAMELKRGVDPSEIQRRVQRTLSEGR